MDHHAIVEMQFFAGLESHASVLRFVSGERALPERIRGEQSVASDMPTGAAGIVRIVENRYPDFLAVDLAEIVAPVAGLTPNFFFRRFSLVIADLPGRSG